jgi:HSP20 family protein
MRVTRYDPLAVLNQLQTELNRAFEGRESAAESSGATADWVPAVDIDEYQDRFVLHVDVPGVEPDSIEITLEKGVLTIRGERKGPGDGEGVIHRRAERVSGAFYRRFTLPDTADADNVTASSNDGVLAVSIHKQAESRPRRIVVNG